MPPCCEKFAQLEWKGAASVCACGSSRHMGPDLGHYSSRVALAREWCYKQSIHIFCKVTFADEITLFKIVAVASMQQCHWIRDKWFVSLDLLSSNITFRSAFQVINEILPLYKMFVFFCFLFCLSEKYFWYIPEGNSIYSSSMTIEFRYGNRQMFLSTLSRNWIELTCGYDGYWTDVFSKLTTPLQSSWWCRDMATLAT